MNPEREYALMKASSYLKDAGYDYTPESLAQALEDVKKYKKALETIRLVVPAGAGPAWAIATGALYD